MSRQKIASQMIRYLEERIYCQNVMKFAKKHMEKSDGTAKKLMVDDIPMAFDIVVYNDNDNYTMQNGDDAKDQFWIQKMFNTFDFITESNYTGFEYFPYLYGVLNCHDDENSEVYLFYEHFDGDLTKLFSKLEHASEWYDISFQIIMISYYVQIQNNYNYPNLSTKNFLYKKLVKPYYKDYVVGDKKFTINHKYLLVLWDVGYMEKIDRTTIDLGFLTNYLDGNADKIKIPPSPRILNLYQDVSDGANNVPNILEQYYSSQSK